MVKYLLQHILVVFVLRAVPGFAQEVSPPRPVFPAQGDSLTVLNPVFTWAPAYPLPESSRAEYTLRVVEILDEQTPEAAIAANPAWYEQKNIKNTLLAYPLLAPALDKTKRYAWQVEVLFYEGKSETYLPRTGAGEVYWFGFSRRAEETCQPVLRQVPDKGHYVVRSLKLPFAFEPGSQVEPGVMQYRITNAAGEVVTPGSLRPAGTATEGYYFSLKQWAPFRKKNSRTQYFTLEATSPQGNVYKFNFTCR